MFSFVMDRGAIGARFINTLVDGTTFQTYWNDIGSRLYLLWGDRLVVIETSPHLDNLRAAIMFARSFAHDCNESVKGNA